MNQPAAGRSRRRLRRYPRWLPYAFIAPHMLLFVGFIAYPFVSGLLISLLDFDYFTESSEFVGLAHYADLFSPDGVYGELFWRTFVNSLIFVAVSTPVMIIGGLALAAFLNTAFTGRLLVRSIVIFPWTLSVTVISLLWWNLLNQSSGFIPKAADALGLETPAWLTSQPWAWISIVIATLWWTVGFNVLIFLAGMQNVRKDLLEAAMLDGATAWDRFLHVTIPELRPVLLLVVTLQIIGGFNMVGQAQLITDGGPSPSSTTTVLLYIYQVGFQGQFAVSAASAMSVVVALAILVVSVVNFRVTNRGGRS